MKKQILSATLLVTTFLCAIPLTSRAHDGDWDENHHYRVDKQGYWDEHNKHQKFVYWHHHHGYWDTHGEKRIFIKVD